MQLCIVLYASDLFDSFFWHPYMYTPCFFLFKERFPLFAIFYTMNLLMCLFPFHVVLLCIVLQMISIIQYMDNYIELISLIEKVSALSTIKKYGSTSQLGIGQVQNGHLYTRYRSSSPKTKQRSAKSLQTTFFTYSNAKSTLKVPLTLIKVEKTKHQIFDFVHLSFFLSSYSSSATRKLYCVCEY